MRRTIMALTLSLTLAACDTPMTDGPANRDLTQSDWAAETINGKPVIEPGKVTLAIVEDRVTGRSGCNLYSGSVEASNGTLKVGQLISTKMACMAEGVMQQERDYLTALGAATSYTFRDDGRLVIGGTLVYVSTPRQQRPEQ